MEDNLYKDLEKLRITDKKTSKPTARRKWPIFLCVFAVGVMIAGTFLFLKKSPTSHNQISFLTVSAQPDTGSPALMTAGGYIVAESEITISSKVAGRIATLNVREGDLVNKGDIIAVLENDELRTRMEEAEATLKKATLSKKYRQELCEKDLIDIKRNRELFKENLISPSQLNKEEKSLVISRLERDWAKSELEVCRKKLQLSKILFEESTLRAPISGTVIDKIADVGEMLFPMKTMEGESGSAVVTLADLRVMNVEVDINEDDIEMIKLKRPALITPDSFPDRTYQGEVIEISPMANRQKNVVPIKVRIENPDEYLKPDMSAKVIFQEKTINEPIKKAGIKKPRSAVVDKNGKNIVCIMEGSKTLEREVTLGTNEGDYVVVEKGLTGGEKIVVEGHSS